MFFNLSPSVAQLGGVQVLAMMNKVGIHVHVQVLCGHEVSTPLCKYQGVQLLDYMVRIC